MALDVAKGEIVDALNNWDQENLDLLNEVIDKSNDIIDNDADITAPDGNLNTEEAGAIQWGGKEASLTGTGGVGLLEYAKDAIQTAVSNISGVGTNVIQMRKLVERKMGGLG